ncbi:MAG: diguanylate phosphodiesterase [Candidatus Accumulibacter sp.]|nr:diguanylate phosphodiesterase [Accumulibacter sp.]MBA4093317.1 diguanylate phosphodiesterase [Accumulibacter sp.]
MINILYIEDDPSDFQLLARHLRHEGMEIDILRVDEPAGLSQALEERRWDAVLTDYNLPQLKFRETLALLCRRLPDCPIILVSGSIGEETAIELSRAGLWDFVLKDNLSRLVPALERGFRDSAQRQARRAAEYALQVSEERFRIIAETITEVIWMADVEQKQIYYVSPAYETLWQRTCASLYAEPRSFLDGIHADDRPRIEAGIRAAQDAMQPFAHEYRVLRPDRSIRWISDHGFPVIDHESRTTRYVGVAKDVTERHHAEERLRQAATVFESTQEGVMITSLDARMMAVNKAFTEITGYSEEEALGMPPSILRSGRSSPDFYQAMWASLLDTGQWRGEIWNRRKNGEVYPAWMTISAVHSEEGKPTHYVSVFSDISQLKRSEEELARLAHYDPLTGLPNRLLLQSRLEHAIDRAERHGEQVALLFIDLDRFKTVNDSLGHVAGDQLLLDAALRLRERVRDEDTLGRFGGDEFLLLLEPIDGPEEAAIVARDLLAVLAQPFRLAGSSEVYIGASIGISIFPDDGATAADLLRDADAAMYQAKDHGRNRFCFYTADMNANAIAQLELEAALRRALEREEFVLHYQPKVDLRSGSVVGAEALIRWNRDGGLEPPGRFIALAEKTGLIVPIGTWVIDTACRQLRRWQDAGLRDLQLAVNVSMLQFYSGDLPEIVHDALTRHGIPAGYLELEVTESMLMEDPEQTIAILHALKRIGVKLSLDDFGTGYSSFTYLSRFPIDTLKIDQSFVRDIVSEPEAAMIAVSIIDLAHRMRLKVVAEGVETEAQLGYLRMQNCDEMQGFHFSGGIPADAFTALVGKGKALPPANARTTGERSILLVGDAPDALATLSRRLAGEALRVFTAESGGRGLEILATHPIQIVVSAREMPRMTGDDFLRRVRELHPGTLRVMLSGDAGPQAGDEGTIHRHLRAACDDDELRAEIAAAFLQQEAAAARNGRFAP